MFRTALGSAIALGLFVLACSSSSTPSTSSSSSSSSSAGPPSCSCTGTTSGQSFEVACGSTQCVAGSTYTCPTAGNLVIGARCGDDDSGVAAGEGCGLFSCRGQSDCDPVGYCFSATDGSAYCYPPANDGGTCTAGETSSSQTTPSGATTLCVPPSCPTPHAFMP